jgi:hypothetical protein
MVFFVFQAAHALPSGNATPAADAARGTINSAAHVHVFIIVRLSSI